VPGAFPDPDPDPDPDTDPDPDRNPTPPPASNPLGCSDGHNVDIGADRCPIVQAHSMVTVLAIHTQFHIMLPLRGHDCGSNHLVYEPQYADAGV
jgi:hypothetical protein